MGNEVAVCVKALQANVSYSAIATRSYMRVWEVNEDTALLPELPEADFTCLFKPNPTVAYIVRHDYVTSDDPARCKRPDDYKLLQPVLFDAPTASSVLGLLDAAIEHDGLLAPFETTEEEPGRSHSLYLWNGREASTAVRAAALGATFHMSSMRLAPADNMVPLPWAVALDLEVVDDGPLPPVTDYFTFADQERVRLAREEATRAAAANVLYLQSNELARTLHLSAGKPHIPAFAQQAQGKPVGDPESVRRCRDALYELF